MANKTEADADIRGLSELMKRGLVRAALAPLWQQRHGWAEEDEHINGLPGGTIDALAQRELVAIDRQKLKGRITRRATLTTRGRWFADTIKRHERRAADVRFRDAAARAVDAMEAERS